MESVRVKDTAYSRKASTDHWGGTSSKNEWDPAKSIVLDW